MKLADEIRDFLVTHSIEATKDKFHPGRKEVTVTDEPCTFLTWKKFMRNEYTGILGITQRTADTYISAVSRVINHVGIVGDEKDNLNLLEFRPEWVETAKKKMVSEADTAEKADLKKRSFNSLLQHLKSLCIPEAKDAFATKGWTFHWLEGVSKIRSYRRCGNIYVQPSEEYIKEIHDFVDSQTGDFYVICMFGLHAGLRRGEIKHVSRDWIQRVGNENRIWVVPNGDFRQKGKGGYTVISDEALEQIEARSLTTSGRYLYKNSKAQFDYATGALRVVRETRTPLHDLRRYFGTYIANKYDLWKAQQYLRHANPQTTWNAYANTLLSEEAMRWWEDWSDKKMAA